MARVASCPQCNHELLVPSEADSESWAKCPDCRAFFQVKQATSRELSAALLVDSHEQQTIDLDPESVAPPTGFEARDDEIAATDQVPMDDEFTATVDDVETEVAELPPSEYQPRANLQTTEIQADDLELDDLLEEPTQAGQGELTALGPDDVETEVAEQPPVLDEIATTHSDDFDLDDMTDKPKKGDELEAAAQRIDEWFRSAKTVPDTSLLDTEVEPDSVEEVTDDLVPSAPSRTNATLDMDADDTNGRTARTDFNLGMPEDMAQTTAAWDDADQMDDLLDDDEPTAEAYAAEFDDDEQAMDGEPTTDGEERPSINLFADGDAPEVESTKRRQRRERSFARPLILIMVAGLFGSAVGYYTLLWLRGPSIDFLSVAQYLPKAILPASFEDSKQIVNTPPAPAVDATADTELPATDGGTDLSPSDPTTEPQELPATTDEIAEPMPDTMVDADGAPADATDQSTEVQAGFTEVEPAADGTPPASAVGDRYSKAGDTEAGAANDSTATGITSEKPAIADLSVDDLASTEAPAADSTADAAAAPSLPAASDPAATEPTDTETAVNEPATFDVTSADPLSDIATTSDVTESVEIEIANAPSFTSDDLSASMDAATKAQPQLVEGNFADGKAVAQTKSRSYAMLADLAQKAMFADASQQAAQPMIEQAHELFRQTLADAHTRGEVAQILPLWVRSPNRKHGGVFFGGTIVSQSPAGSVVECKVELDGGQTLTVLAPANAADQLDTAKPMAIVGWIVDAPKSQISGYTGGAKSAAIWTKELVPLQ